MTYYRVGHPTQAEAIPAGPSAMSFRWKDNKLTNWGMTFGRSEHSGYSLRGLLDVLVGVSRQQIECPASLHETRLPGDWVWRGDAKREVVLAQLERILRDEFNLDVSLEFRKVDRAVYVARGEYEFKPLPGQPAEEKRFLTDETLTTDPIQIFGKELGPDNTSGGGGGDFDEFLRSVGQWVNQSIVAEVSLRPSRQITWTYYERSPPMNHEDHDPEIVLNNVFAQTNVQFTREMRAVELLFVRPRE